MLPRSESAKTKKKASAKRAAPKPRASAPATSSAPKPKEPPYEGWQPLDADARARLAEAEK